MKKLFLNFMTIVFAMSLILVSCDPKNGNDDTTPDDPNGDGNVEQEQPSTPSWEEQGYTVADAAFGTAYPDYAYTDLILANETDTLVISLNTEGEETLSVGEYTMDDSGEYPAGTWDPEYTWLWNAENEVMVIDGTVSVTKAGRNYTVKADCIDENGDSVKWVYTGQIELEVYSTDDTSYGEVEAEDFSVDAISGEAGFYGDYAENGTSNYYVVLVDENGGYFILDLYAVGTGTTEAIPSATYTISDTYAENTAFSGYSDMTAGELVASYYFTDNNGDGKVGEGEVFYLTEGNIVVAESEGTYTITGDVVSALGTNIDFTYTGAITITDETETASAAPAKKSIVAKQGKKLNKRLARK